MMVVAANDRSSVPSERSVHELAEDIDASVSLLETTDPDIMDGVIWCELEDYRPMLAELIARVDPKTMSKLCDEFPGLHRYLLTMLDRFLLELELASAHNKSDR